MIKLNKAQKEHLHKMQTFDDFEKEYFTNNPEALEEYKKAALEEYANDPAMSARELLTILRRIVELEGYSKFAKKAKLAREHIYRAIAPTGNPTLSTMEKLAASCGLRVGFIPK